MTKDDGAIFALGALALLALLLAMKATFTSVFLAMELDDKEREASALRRALMWAVATEQPEGSASVGDT